jgi:hypothetical protein
MSGPPAGPNVAGVPVDLPQPVATAGGSQEAGAAPAAAARGVVANQAEVSLADLSRAEGQLVGLLNTAAAILQVQRCTVLKRGVRRLVVRIPGNLVSRGLPSFAGENGIRRELHRLQR